MDGGEFGAAKECSTFIIPVPPFKRIMPDLSVRSNSAVR